MHFSIDLAEEFTLFLDDRPGILADLCGHLADHRVSIRAMSTSRGDDTGTVHLVVDDPVQARAMFDEAGVHFTTATCLALEMPNAPGGFARVARVLALAGINIDSIYASAAPRAGVAFGILSVSDPEAAMSLDWSLLND